MSNWFPAMWAEASAKIATVWDDAQVNMRESQAGRLNWRRLLQLVELGEAGQFNTPFIVMQAGRSTPVDMGMGNTVYETPITFYFVQSARDQDEMDAHLEEKGMGAADAFARGKGFTSFQLMNDATVDSSPANEANAYFLATNIPLQAVAVTQLFMTGDSQ